MRRVRISCHWEPFPLLWSAQKANIQESGVVVEAVFQHVTHVHDREGCLRLRFLEALGPLFAINRDKNVL